MILVHILRKNSELLIEMCFGTDYEKSRQLLCTECNYLDIIKIMQQEFYYLCFATFLCFTYSSPPIFERTTISKSHLLQKLINQVFIKHQNAQKHFSQFLALHFYAEFIRRHGICFLIIQFECVLQIYSSCSD